MHGTIDDLDHRRLTHRGLSDRKLFIRHLRERSEKYVSWDAALRGKGDALTVDDATVASAEAARLAVEYGHRVTLFINPGYIEYQRPHFFCVLSSVLEQAECSLVTWQRNRYELRDPDQRSSLRAQVKKKLRQLATEEQRLELLERLAQRVCSLSLAVPHFLSTLKFADLRELRMAGIDIESHGWFHGELASLSLQDQINDITGARDWLTNKLGVNASAYAVPFGETVPSEQLRQIANVVFFCLNERLPSGAIYDRTVNRISLSFKDS